MTDSTLLNAPGIPQIAADEALKTARADAESVYGDLSGYRITIVLEEEGWRIDYDLTDPHVKGGGPHYVIDSISGRIVSKRYEQ